MLEYLNVISHAFVIKWLVGGRAIMQEIIKIEKGIFQYIFEEGINITALIEKNEALLIDSAFPKQSKEVQKELQKKGVKVTKIILSHYHPDHAAGVSVFSEIQLMCSKNYKQNYEKCIESWDPENIYIKPDKELNHNDIEFFGEFKIQLLEAPGHSKCSLIILINDNIAHVGDLIMEELNSKPVLPGISYDGSIKEHIHSLEMLKLLDVKKIIMGHGRPIIGKEKIHNSIEDRLFYLRKVKNSGGNISLESCLRGSVNDWSVTSKEFHENNLKMWNS